MNIYLLIVTFFAVGLLLVFALDRHNAEDTIAGLNDELYRKKKELGKLRAFWDWSRTTDKMKFEIEYHDSFEITDGESDSCGHNVGSSTLLWSDDQEDPKPVLHIRDEDGNVYKYSSEKQR